MLTEKKDFTSILDRDLFTFDYVVEVLNKNGSLYQDRQYSNSFDKWEIYDDLKSKFPKKSFTIRLKIN